MEILLEVILGDRENQRKEILAKIERLSEIMKKYTITIIERTEETEEKVYEFYSDNDIVYYTIDKETYENSKKFLDKSLTYMIDAKVDTKRLS